MTVLNLFFFTKKLCFYIATDNVVSVGLACILDKISYTAFCIIINLYVEC